MFIERSELADAAVLVPLRSLRDGKLRLADALGTEARAELIKSMAEIVLAAAGEIDVLVVHEDHAVAEWAEACGASALRPDQPGLNKAVAAGHRHLRAAGYERVIIAHADLPLAKDLSVMLQPAPITIAPDRHRDGTNVMCVPAALEFPFAYGPGSFRAHQDASRSLGIEPVEVNVPDLSWDVDNPEDLEIPDQTLAETPDQTLAETPDQTLAQTLPTHESQS